MSYDDDALFELSEPEGNANESEPEGNANEFMEEPDEDLIALQHGE